MGDKIIHIKCCPVCANYDFVHHATCEDHFATHEKFALDKCTGCGFIFTRGFPDEESIGKYYDVPEYISHSDTQKGIINALYHRARKLALKSKADTVIRYSGLQRGSLLDVGSGTGYFLNKMKRLGWEVAGIERSEPARKYAKMKFDIDCRDSTALFDMPARSRDVITLWHVLEHLQAPGKVMQKLHEILTDEGVLFIALPNSRSYDAGYYKDKWAAYDVPRHLWHFSPGCFEQLATRHNFQLTAIRPMLFDAMYISMLSEKYKGSFMANLTGLIRGSVFSACSLFNKNKCSSLIYILKKK